MKSCIVKNSQSRNYELDFGKGVFMCVKKNDTEKSFKWGGLK